MPKEGVGKEGVIDSMCRSIKIKTIFPTSPNEKELPLLTFVGTWVGGGGRAFEWYDISHWPSRILGSRTKINHELR